MQSNTVKLLVAVECCDGSGKIYPDSCIRGTGNTAEWRAVVIFLDGLIRCRLTITFGPLNYSLAGFSHDFLRITY